jgi:hypothetical protein
MRLDVDKLVVLGALLAYLSLFVIASYNDQPVQCTTDIECAMMYPDVEPY